MTGYAEDDGAEMKHFIGIDLGGTNIKAGLVDLEAGKLIGSKSVPTVSREGPDAVMIRMADLAIQLIGENKVAKSDVGGIGIGVPGLLDLQKGTTKFLPNLPGNWPDIPLRDTITSRTGIPAAILNDARAITFGEWKFGAGRGVDTMACFTLGTGVGGGLVINSRLHLGSVGAAGELGHQTIDFNGPRCGCGNRGCLEAYATGPAIGAMGVKAVMQGLTTSIGKLVNYDLNKIGPDTIAQAARDGDAVAKEIYDTVGMYYGIAIANVCVFVLPQKVVLAGGVAAAGELLFEPIRKTLKERVTMVPVDQVDVVQAELGNNAGVMGVALWAKEQIPL